MSREEKPEVNPQQISASYWVNCPSGDMIPVTASRLPEGYSRVEIDGRKYLKRVFPLPDNKDLFLSQFGRMAHIIAFSEMCPHLTLKVVGCRYEHVLGSETKKLSAFVMLFEDCELFRMDEEMFEKPGVDAKKQIARLLVDLLMLLQRKGLASRFADKYGTDSVGGMTIDDIWLRKHGEHWIPVLVGLCPGHLGDLDLKDQQRDAKGLITVLNDQFFGFHKWARCLEKHIGKNEALDRYKSAVHDKLPEKIDAAIGRELLEEIKPFLCKEKEEVEPVFLTIDTFWSKLTPASDDVRKPDIDELKKLLKTLAESLGVKVSDKQVEDLVETLNRMLALGAKQSNDGDNADQIQSRREKIFTRAFHSAFPPPSDQIRLAIIDRNLVVQVFENHNQ